jgi:hypothetical protein
VAREHGKVRESSPMCIERFRRDAQCPSRLSFLPHVHRAEMRSCGKNSHRSGPGMAVPARTAGIYGIAT